MVCCQYYNLLLRKRTILRNNPFGATIPMSFSTFESAFSPVPHLNKGDRSQLEFANEGRSSIRAKMRYLSDLCTF